MAGNETAQSLPAWFKQPVPRAGEMADVEKLLRELRLHTVCDGARCPNRGYCYSHHTATFMILGNACTRNCTFCNVTQGKPLTVEPDEPVRVAEAIRRLKLSYVVITSVTRDDLPDGGAAHFAATIESIHFSMPEVKVEVLVPDFKGNLSSIVAVMDAQPDIFAHNLETCPRLYPEVRPKANYQRSLEVLGAAKQYNPQVITKSALMLGLGEARDEVIRVMNDLRSTGCDLFTLGQYLAMRTRHPVVRYLAPEEFEEYEQIALKAGFKAVASAPLVRSSFKAAELHDTAYPIDKKSGARN